MKIAILHGTMGSPTRNWFPWLKAELENLGHTVIVPAFPTPNGQCLQNWYSTFNLEFGFQNLARDTILIGHSLGAAFALRTLQEACEPIAGCFLVAGFIRSLGFPDFDDLNQTFIAEPFDWDNLRAQAGNLFVYNSDNDPYVPLKYGEELATHLGVKLRVIPSGGHINSESGFSQFPIILNDLLGVFKQRQISTR